MAECIILKGGGADLDPVTATAPDILAGKVIVDKNGEPLTGVMPNQGAISQSLGINGAYTIPAGYHNGSGKVTQNIPVQGADAGADYAWATQVSGNYTSGDIYIGVRNGYYMNGVNWIKAHDDNWQPGNIRSGVTIFGKPGTMVDYSYLAVGQVPF